LAKIYYDNDANIEFIKEKVVGIIGYGNQGHAQALNLRDSGAKVLIGELEGSLGWEKAKEAGFVAERTDNMIIVNGVGFFPTQIGNILAKIEGAEPRFQLIIDREGTQDVMDIMVEVSESIFFDEMRRFHELKKRIEEI